MTAEERAAYVALALTPGIGTQRLTVLLASCQTALGALQAPFAFLRALPGMNAAAATAVTSASPELGRSALDATADLGGSCLLPSDPDFPAALREIPERPTLLFAAGDLGLLRRPAVAIVGSRDHSAYGAEVCRRVASAAAGAGLAVVSGMARGLDALAHRAALDAAGATIGVLGNGLGVIYPAANRDLYQAVGTRGLLLTEFPPGERPAIGTFPRRNRLISGLARVTIVVEAAAGSGTLITVAAALEQGREVMVVPGNITSPTSVGTNRLARDGAEPLLQVEDLLGHYPELASSPAAPSGDVEPRAPTGLSRLEGELFVMLRRGPASPDELVLAAGRAPGEVLAALSGLELRQLATQLAGRVVLTSGART